MEPNIDRMQWSVVAMLAAIVVGGVVLLAFPKISGKIANSMNDTVDSAFSGEKPVWVGGADSEIGEKFPEESDPKHNSNLFTYRADDQIEGKLIVSGFNDEYVKEFLEGVEPIVFNLPDSYKGQEVIGTYHGAFENKVIENVVIPNNYKKLADYTFHDVKGLKKIVIPDGLEIIGARAFMGVKVEDLVLGSSVKEIGPYAFSDNNLHDITLPDSIESIGDHAFGTFKSKRPNVVPGGTIKFPNKRIKVSRLAFKNIQSEKVILPEDMSDFYGAIFQTSSVKEVVFQGSPKMIPGYLFSEAKIESIVIPDSVVSIGKHAFEYNKITKIHIPSSVRTIGEKAFYSNSLHSITFDEGVEEIENAAFFGYVDTNSSEKYSKELLLPHSLIKMGDGAFAGNVRFEVIGIGDGLREIGNNTPALEIGGTLLINLQEDDNPSEGIVRGQKYKFNVGRTTIVKQYK